MTERVVVAVISALAGGMLTYGAKTLTLEGRLDAIERALVRIEQRIYPVGGRP